jgi:1,4-dihydroxy-2-naphthoate octaprenyltransferase
MWVTAVAIPPLTVGAVFRETRPQFLTLSVVLAIHGAAMAAWEGSFDWGLAILALVGLAFLHAAVNVLNDWHDWSRTKIDYYTESTAFSGGSGMLPRGEISTRAALVIGCATLAVGVGIGLYLTKVCGWPVLALGVFGVGAVVLYTPVLAKLGIGEAITGVALGSFPVVGTFYVLAGTITPAAWLSSIPAAIMTYNLLLVNEFPDADADIRGGRRHMVIVLGRTRAARLFAVLELGAFAIVVVGVIASVLPPWALLGLIGLPFAVKSIMITWHNRANPPGMPPAQANHVMSTMALNFFLGVGYVITAFVG